MKLLMGVFMIRFIVGLFENKAKGNKKNGKQYAEQNDAKHPAEFQVR
jgi:hypothetical protein